MVWLFPLLLGLLLGSAHHPSEFFVNQLSLSLDCKLHEDRTLVHCVYQFIVRA